MTITILGKPRFTSPVRRTVSDDLRVPEHIVQDGQSPSSAGNLFELAGPRAKLFFDPKQTRAGIVTCGGLCPGLNDVIRSLFLELHHAYGVKEVLGFRGGYQGLDPARGAEPIVLTQAIRGQHPQGGRHGAGHVARAGGYRPGGGQPDPPARRYFSSPSAAMARSAAATTCFRKRSDAATPLAVVGIPKTVDNDVAFVTRTFGYLTAVQEAAKVLDRAHTEARSVHNGIALVKLMGRHAGFIAAGATVASQDVNFTLVPEVPFKLEGKRGFLAALRKRILKRAHAVVVVAEGAGQDLLEKGQAERDASGNVKLKDIGPFLRDRIEAHFKTEKIPVVMRYFDPELSRFAAARPTPRTRSCAIFSPATPCTPRWPARPGW